MKDLFKQELAEGDLVIMIKRGALGFCGRVTQGSVVVHPFQGDWGQKRYYNDGDYLVKFQKSQLTPSQESHYKTQLHTLILQGKVPRP